MSEVKKNVDSRLINVEYPLLKQCESWCMLYALLNILAPEEVRLFLLLTEEEYREIGPSVENVEGVLWQINEALSTEGRPDSDLHR